ncbi:MAG: c-type cytochrome domain-containing protein, partial [Verrucomicrobiota bacterium]
MPCSPPSLRTALTSLVLGLGAVCPLTAQQEFQQVIVPFLDKHCYECHDADLKKGGLDLEAIKDDAAMFRQQRMWRELLQLVAEGQMPPAKTKVRPTQPEIDALSGAVSTLLRRATAAQKPDPGAVTVRRLNRTEFNAT